MQYEQLKSTLETYDALVALLLPHAGEGGESEGAIETLARIIRGRGNLRVEVARLETDLACSVRDREILTEGRADLRLGLKHEQQHAACLNRERDEARLALGVAIHERDAARVDLHAAREELAACGHFRINTSVFSSSEFRKEWAEAMKPHLDGANACPKRSVAAALVAEIWNGGADVDRLKTLLREVAMNRQ